MEYTIGEKMPNKQLQVTKGRGRHRGRPKLDIALRVRNWIWYWLIKSELQLSDDALDARFASTIGGVRPRLFFRIRSMGSSPDEMRGYRSRKSVFHLVHEKEPERCSAARQVFESPLWSLLLSRNDRAEIIATIIQQVLSARGWYRANPEQAAVGTQALGIGEPAFDPVGVAYPAMVTHLSMQDDFESLALLAALFLEAHAELQLHRALMLRDALESVVLYFLSRGQLPEQLRMLFKKLIQDRILGNKWIEESGLPVGERAKQTRVAEIKTFAASYAEKSSQSVKQSTLPIVSLSPRLEWLMENYAKVIVLLAQERAGSLAADDEQKGLSRSKTDAKAKRRQHEIAAHRKSRRELPKPPPRDVSGALGGEKAAKQARFEFGDQWIPEGEKHLPGVPLGGPWDEPEG